MAGEGIIDQDLPLSHALVHLHTYIPVPVYLQEWEEEWDNGPSVEDALQLSAVPGPYLYLFNPNLRGIYKYNYCLQQLCFTPGEEQQWFYGPPFTKLSNHSEQAKFWLVFKVRAGNFIEQMLV